MQGAKVNIGNIKSHEERVPTANPSLGWPRRLSFESVPSSQKKTIVKDTNLNTEVIYLISMLRVISILQHALPQLSCTWKMLLAGSATAHLALQPLIWPCNRSSGPATAHLALQPFLWKDQRDCLNKWINK